MSAASTESGMFGWLHEYWKEVTGTLAFMWFVMRSHISLDKRITALEAHCDGCKTIFADISASLKEIAGMDRRLARIEGKLSAKDE